MVLCGQWTHLASLLMERVAKLSWRLICSLSPAISFEWRGFLNNLSSSKSWNHLIVGVLLTTREIDRVHAPEPRATIWPLKNFDKSGEKKFLRFFFFQFSLLLSSALNSNPIKAAIVTYTGFGTFSWESGQVVLPQKSSNEHLTYNVTSFLFGHVLKSTPPPSAVKH